MGDTSVVPWRFPIFFVAMAAGQLRLWYPPTTANPPQLHIPLPPGYIYKDPIPPATAKSPGELLADFYAERRNERHWTDSGLLAHQLHVHIHYRQHAVRPIGSLGLVGEWERPNGLKAERVPVCVALGEPHLGVEFKNLNRRCPSAGIPLIGLYKRRVDLIEGANDVVFKGLEGMNLNFVLAWPGYPVRRSMISTVTDDGRPVTRLDLGRAVTMIYAELFRIVEVKKILPTQVGFYNIALHQGKNAKSDSLGVQLPQVHLVRIRGTLDGIWVADVDIV